MKTLKELKQKSSDLCIEYAKNRMTLKEIWRTIEYPNFKDVDLREARENYINQYPDHWSGWVDMLKCTEEYSKRDMELAELLDKKKKILKEAGTIKRKIYQNGKSLINYPHSD